MITLIAAMSKNRVIGNKGSIPWKIPNDTEFFRKTTKFCPVIMGRKTFESIGRVLPDRKNIILTRNKSYVQDGCLIYDDIQKVIMDFGRENLMVIGGEEVYRQFLPYADRICLTYIDKEFEGDTFFPEFSMTEWELVSEEKGLKNDDNPYDYYFRWYNKIK
jgi:dihydrofolate reductase